MKGSKIEWCDHTFNGWIGCTKVSPGCAHCYAEARDRRFAGGVHWGPGAPRRRVSAETWQMPKRWNRFLICDGCGRSCEAWANGPGRDNDGRERLRCVCDCGGQAVSHWAHRSRVFCLSLGDWLDEEVPVEWLADLLSLIHSTPNLDWLLLTKRPGNFKERLHRVNLAQPETGFDEGLVNLVSGWIDGFAPANVWVGTTVEDQARAEERIPLLLRIPARVRFLSCEPMLEGIKLRGLGWYCEGHQVPLASEVEGKAGDGRLCCKGVDWVICGGESGPGRRGFELDWARDVREQCQGAGVAFFMKQVDKVRGIPEDLLVREFPATGVAAKV